MIIIPDHLQAVVPIPLDAKLSNLQASGSNTIVETIPAYLQRVSYHTRYLGMIVSVIHPSGIYDNNSYFEKIDNAELQVTLYGFISGIEDADFLPWEVGGTSTTQTRWTQVSSTCELDAEGRRTGLASILEKEESSIDGISWVETGVTRTYSLYNPITCPLPSIREVEISRSCNLISGENTGYLTIIKDVEQQRANGTWVVIEANKTYITYDPAECPLSTTDLPIATTTELGVIIVGEGLSVTEGVLSSHVPVTIDSESAELASINPTTQVLTLTPQDVSGFVPYTGATTNVDLGANNLTTTGKFLGGTGVTDILKLQGTSGNGTLTSPAIQALVGNNGATTALTILNNGNVGIGTTNPQNKLDINGGTTDTYLRFYSGDLTHKVGVILAGDNVTANSQWQILKMEGTHKFAIRNGAFSEVFDILQNGNVGIGTTSPSNKLTVAGPILSAAGTSDTILNGLVNQSGFVLLGDNAFWGIRQGTNQSVNIDVYNANNEITALTILQSGNVGIGTTTPTAYLNIKAGTATTGTAPLKFTSGTLLTTPEVGAIEFLNDAYYGTITTGGARKQFAFTDSPLSSHASTHAVGGSDTVFPASPGADKFLKYNNTTSNIEWADAGASGWNESVQVLTGIIPTFNPANGLNATITVTAPTTITFVALVAGMGGIIDVFNYNLTTITVAGSYTFKISRALNFTGDVITMSAVGNLDQLTWYYNGNIVVIGGQYNLGS